MSARWKSPRRLARILTLPALVAGILIPSAVYGTAHHQAAHRTTLAAVQAPAPLDAMNVMAVTRLTAVRAEVAREERAEARARHHEAVLLAARQRVLAAQAARAHVAAVAAVRARTVAPAVSEAVYSYAGIEGLWLAAGGNPAYASMAACIAEHESGGRANAVSATADFGVFQEHQDPAALNPQVSAVTAVAMSSQHTRSGAVISGTSGQNWSAWTTSGYC